MQLSITGFSNPGRGEANQDKTFSIFAKDGAALLAIADGMGGHTGGAIASNLAVDAVREIFISMPDTGMAALFGNAHNALLQRAKSIPNLSDMGTTLSLCLISGSEVNFGHVGDTRIYHLHGQEIRSITVDQTEVQLLIQKGILDKTDADRYPRRNVLISALGPYVQYDLQQGSFTLHENDRILLLTDGAHQKISKNDIRDISLVSSLDQLLQEIESGVEKAGVTDDYSALGAEYIP